jgi:nucleoporin NUP82
MAVPDVSHLSADSNEPIKPKTWTLGPTTHVMDRAAIISALWHPLGVNGSALVTVTADAIVRLWELSPSDRWSFDKPTLTIDLRKLADGTFLEGNFAASNDGRKGFSPDDYDMDVAAASFASRGSGGWSPMTLWVAMKNGDVYALCPLLPTRWSPPPTLIPSLSIAIVENLAAVEDDADVPEQAKLLAHQQLAWMSDLDNQEPTEINGSVGEPVVEVYKRPAKPGVIPKLQGPFDLQLAVDSADELDLELTDIFVIGQKLDTGELMMGEDEELDVDDIDEEGLSLNIICLLSASGQLQVCLDLVGVQAQWLPPRSKSKSLSLRATGEGCSLLVFQTLDTLTNLEVTPESWATFSPDITSRYGFFVTHRSSITFVSLSPWVFRLETELHGESGQGAEFRIDLLVKGQSSLRERLHTDQQQGPPNQSLAAAVAIRDPDIGYLLLSATAFEPIAIIFDTPEYDFEVSHSSPPAFKQEEDVLPLDFSDPRPTYQPSHCFEESSALPALLERLRTSRHKAIVNQEIRLSPVTLQIFTDAHKILSEETHRLGHAASELFRRLGILQFELTKHINKAEEVKGRVAAITGEDQDEEAETSSAAVERRLVEVQNRSDRINERLERLRKTVGKGVSRELSDKEQAWFAEISTLNASLNGAGVAAPDGPSRLKQLGKRYEEAHMLKRELLSQAKGLVESTSATAEVEEGLSASSADLRIPSDLRRAKISQVRGMLERETALVEAVKARVERLSLSAS